MKIRYKIVDMEGDEIDLSLFTPGITIPTRMKEVLVVSANEMVITLEYLHGQPS